MGGYAARSAIAEAHGLTESSSRRHFEHHRRLTATFETSTDVKESGRGERIYVLACQSCQMGKHALQAP